ncbi:hypothetical protein V498_03993, partial [Pseudogymnoascus sp. VKM F-4517 (FW-2822)]
MRLCVSDSGPDQLSRLRNGSQWVNEQISKYVTLGHLPMEFIFRCAMSMNKYGTLAQSPRESENYLGRLVPIGAPEKSPEAYIPLFVPSFVQVVLKGCYTLREVCKKLRVPESYVNEKTESLCHQYAAIRDALSQECLLPSPESQKRTMDEQPGSSVKSKKHKHNDHYEPSTSSTPTECHSGTEDTALVSPSEKEGSAENNRTSPDDLQTNRHLPEKTAFDGIGSLLEAAGRIQKEPNRASQNQVRIDPTSPKHPTDRFSGHNIPHLPVEVYDDGRSLESCLGPEINVEKWDRILDSERNSGNWVPYPDPEINVDTNDENWDPPVLDPELNNENRVPLFGPEPELNGSWAPLDNNPALDNMSQDHLFGPEPELNGSWAPLDNNPALDNMLQDHLFGPEPELNGSWAPLDNNPALDNMLQDHLFGPEPELNGSWAPLDNNPALDNMSQDHLFGPEPELNGSWAPLDN